MMLNNQTAATNTMDVLFVWLMFLSKIGHLKLLIG